MSIVDFKHHEPGSHPALLLVSHIVTPVVLGGIITVALFYLMQYLIASHGPVYTKAKNIQLVNFVRVPQMSEVQTRDLHPKKPPPPEKMPPVRNTENFNVQVHAASFSMQPVKPAPTGRLTEGWTFESDGNYMPIVKVAPIYPTSAEMTGQEGWVVLQFTINKEGRVIDPEVVDDCAEVTAPGKHVAEQCEENPNSVFDQSALDAARKFKYRPKVVNGVAVAVPHVRHKFLYILGD